MSRQSEVIDSLGVGIERTVNSIISRTESRRAFLRNGAVAAFAGTIVGASKPAGAAERAPGTPMVAKPAAPAKPAAAFGTDDMTAATIAADEMDRMHEAGIKAFPAPSKGRGNQLLSPRMEKGVKVFDLTAGRVQWETEPGKVGRRASCS